MPSFNKVILMGHLTRDPQLKHLGNQTAVAEFGLAVNRKFKVGDEQREDVLFIDCAAFGKQAEVINQYCQKGKAILIDGRLKLDQWEDKQTGAKRSKISAVVENFQFVGGRDGGGDDEGQRPTPRPTGKPATNPIGDGPGIPEEDIPFSPNLA